MKRNARIQIIKSKGQWYFRVVKNGKIICHSEKYRRKAGAVNGAGLLCSLDWADTKIFADGFWSSPYATTSTKPNTNLSIVKPKRKRK